MLSYLLNISDLTLISVSDRSPYAKHYTSLSRHTINELKESHHACDAYTRPPHSRIYSNVHYHSDEEIRLIIRGSATFYIPENDVLYVIDTGPGDQLTLPPNTPHWFSCFGELTALRFFSNNDEHVSMVTSLSQEVSNAHARLKHKFDIRL